MVIIDCNEWTKNGYLGDLSKRARQEYRLCSERNQDLIYRQADWDTDKVREFMNLWEKQLVRGKPIQWAYPVETVERWYAEGKILLFEAVKRNTVAMHFLKREGNYWEAQPPMWDKANLAYRHLGTWMWYQVILYGIENKIGIINLGGGVDKWREMLHTRDQYANPKYKFRFIPRSIKDNPDLQPNYEIINGNIREIHSNLT